MSSSHLTTSPYSTGIIWDKNTKKVKLSFDLVDPIEVEKLSQSRLNICSQCENLRKDKLMCKLCGCNLLFKSRLIYSLDSEGKAYDIILENGEIQYICKLKKW